MNRMQWNRVQKILLVQVWYFAWLIAIAIGIVVLGVKQGRGSVIGMALLVFIGLFAMVFSAWQIYAYSNYRYCRQEEFLHVLQSAADTQAPVEWVLRAYLRDRPRDDVYRFWVGLLLCFVFPGYYWIHKQRSFDARMGRLAAMMQGGASLNQALRLVPGVVSREVALAIAVGQFSGKLAQALRQLPDRRLALQWLETAPRLAYPLLVLTFMLFATSFMMIFIVPKYEKIFLEFKIKLPYFSEVLISVSRWMTKYWWLFAFAAIFAFVLTNLMMLSSRVRWNVPLLGRLYRLYARGQFLHVLGLMLQSGKPLPEILGSVTESGLLPTAVLNRARLLHDDLVQGLPLADGLVRRGLATESMRALIVSAEKANNLPWALEALGDSLTRQSARISQRIALVAFPLLVFAIGAIVAFVSVAMFLPLVEILDSLGARA